MIEQFKDANKVFTAKPIALPNNAKNKPFGQIYEDFYVVPVSDSEGKLKTHLVQSGKFYIREPYLEEGSSSLKYKDIMIDPTTLEDVTNPVETVFLGCDLAREIDLAYFKEREEIKENDSAKIEQ